MSKLTLTLTILLTGLAGCSTRSSPAETPADVETEADEAGDPAEEAEPAIDEVEQGATGTAAMEAEEQAGEEEAEAAQADAGTEVAAPAKKPCAELAEDRCKITSGCAWSSDKKCVEQ